MTQLHYKGSIQPSWKNTLNVSNGIPMLCDAGSSSVLFTIEIEDIHKRPEGIRMQKQ